MSMQLAKLWAAYACGCIVAILIAMKGLVLVMRRQPVLPPSPRGRWPLIGHLHLMKMPLHRSLHKLAQAHGPLLFLDMGCTPTLVVSSARWAREFLHTHERDFADRPQGEASRRLFYGNQTVVMMDHGPVWQELKKLYTVHMLSRRRVAATAAARQAEVAAALEILRGRADAAVGVAEPPAAAEVQVRKLVFSVVGNMITRMLLNRRLFGYGDGSSGFEEMVEEMAVLFGTPLVGDHIPCLAWLDLGGHKRRLNRLSLRFDSFLERVLTARLQETRAHHPNPRIPSRLSSSIASIANTYTHNIPSHHHNCQVYSSCVHTSNSHNIFDSDTSGIHSSSSSEHDDDDDDDDDDDIDTYNGDDVGTQHFLNLLLDIYKDVQGRGTIKGILLDLLSAGIETTTTLVEWAMAELLKNPLCMKKLQDELAMATKSHCQSNGDENCDMGHMPTVHSSCKHAQMNDDAILKLPYLQAVIKETLRLHPPLPVLIRQMSKCLASGKELSGFKLPPKTKLLVNIWALGRDTTIWGEDACSFCPDKFLAPNSIDMRGQHFEFLPFGTGRRGCPGINLGLSMASSLLANFLCFFDWKIPYGYTLDLSEAASRTAPMATPLKAVPFPK